MKQKAPPASGMGIKVHKKLVCQGERAALKKRLTNKKHEIKNKDLNEIERIAQRGAELFCNIETKASLSRWGEMLFFC